MINEEVKGLDMLDIIKKAPTKETANHKIKLKIGSILTVN